MKNSVTYLLVAAMAVFHGSGAFGATSVSRHGITWTFDRDRVTGQYANGDPWVVGPVVITAISPKPSVGRNVVVCQPS